MARNGTAYQQDMQCRFGLFLVYLPQIVIAKRTILHCKTHHFALQNWHYWNAKLALLECKTGTIGIQIGSLASMKWAIFFIK